MGPPCIAHFLHCGRLHLVFTRWSCPGKKGSEVQRKKRKKYVRHMMPELIGRKPRTEAEYKEATLRQCEVEFVGLRTRAGLVASGSPLPRTAMRNSGG